MGGAQATATRGAVLSSFHIYSLEHTEQLGPRTVALVSALSLRCYSTQPASGSLDVANILSEICLCVCNYYSLRLEAPLC